LNSLAVRNDLQPENLSAELERVKLMGRIFGQLEEEEERCGYER
jgi:hypothetical protein